MSAPVHYVREICQRRDCTRPTRHGAVFTYKCTRGCDRHRVDSTIGSCTECRPFFVEKILPDIARDLELRGLRDVQFELVDLTPADEEAAS
jgi:hypothetical protein